MTVAAPASRGGSGESADRREARAAIAIAGGLYFVGGLLCATAALLPHVSSPAAIVAVGLDALFTAALLELAAARGWGGLRMALVADVWGIFLIAILCASGGGPGSPFALIYFFALGHAAAFQPRRSLVAVAAVCLVAFLAPLAYEAHVPETFGAVACVGIVLALLAAVVIHFALERLREQRRRMEILIDATAKLDSSLDPDETLRTIAYMAVPELAELCVIDLLDDTGAVGVTVAAASAPAVASGVERMRQTFPLDLASEHPVARVLAGKQPYVMRDVRERGALAQIAQSAEHERFMRDAGYARAAVFPMVARGRTHGAISFLHLHSDARYDPNLLAVLEDLAGRAALAYDNARLYEERAHVARTLRRGLVPAVLPRVPGLALARFFRPSGSEVGGDFYDAFGDPESFWLVVGDVCGKGAEAAALTGFLRHTIAAYARERAHPAQVLAQVNASMLEQEFDGRFATVVLAHVVGRRPDAERGGDVEVTVALAGHPAALVTRADGRVAELGAHGALLGVFEKPQIEEAATVLGPGDALALYTDGLVEAHAPARTVSAADMLARLRLAAPATAQGTVDALLELIDVDDGVRDDIAILALQVERASVAQAAAAGQPISGERAATEQAAAGTGVPAATAAPARE